jgi:hypothetical protein
MDDPGQGVMRRKSDQVLEHEARMIARTIARAELARLEMVDHPPHYTAHPSGIECIDVAEHMNFNLGNSVKYIWRAGLKHDAVEDLKKARWYLDREIARLAAP